MLLLFLLLFTRFVVAENGIDGWLRYPPISVSSNNLPRFPHKIVALNTSESSPVHIAGLELQRGIAGIFGKELGVVQDGCNSSAIIVGTVDQYVKSCDGLEKSLDLIEDDFFLEVKDDMVLILGYNARGSLYGAFEYLSMLAQGNTSKISYTTNPHAPIRWVNQWDNLDGSIERGYAGPSIFFENGVVMNDLTRVSQYARLLASIRVNAVIINNVNANASLLSPQNIKGLGRIADVFRPYGIQLGISLNFASPQTFGGLNTFDPLDTSVIKWWSDITDQIYQKIPDMAGYLVKANSEGQPGPLTYNRTLADGANLFAKALNPHGGVVMFRAFVYNNHINETEWKADRANAAVEFFKELDGQFDDNVVVQIKYGPINFQVREPVSPLFANLRNTSVAIELQVTQEYLGQQCHVVYLPPLWKTILDFDLRIDEKSSLVRDVISGSHFKRNLGGYAAVVNVGTNTSWLGSHLAMSNLYAYGRLAWDPADDIEEVLQDWIRLTFGHDEDVINIISEISMDSWPAYENYTGNLGIQTLTDILYTHFGPNPASQDNNGWGQWTRADHDSIGMDRTVKNGTGFSSQYPRQVAEMYENIESTPDELLLWFHHVEYKHRLKSGDSVIQHFYDAHYNGAETAQHFPSKWESLRGKIDRERFDDIHSRLNFQAGHSIIWRDAINNFYLNLSGISDEKKRVGYHPWRIEAEDMELNGYVPVSVQPFETASNSTAIISSSNITMATASAIVNYSSGKYDLAINYYDLIEGRSHWQVYVNDRMIGEWIGNNEDILGHAPSTHLDGHSATRITFYGIEIQQGDVVKIAGIPDGIELAPLDYIALLPKGVID